MALRFLNSGYFAGKVGIGIQSPAAKLHVNPTTTDEIAIAINGTQNYSAGEFQRIAAGDSSSINRLSIGFGYDNPTDWAIRYSSYGRHEFYTGNDWGNAANTEKMVITSAGNVGIGTGSPAARLHVYTQTGNPTVLVGRGSGQSSIKASADADGGYLALDSSGNGLILNHYSSDNVWLVTGGGNVGVGNTGPSQKLHITGNLRVTGTYYDSNNTPGTSGQILSSTATGTDWIDGSAIPGVPAGSGTGNYLARWTPNGDTLGIGVVYDNGTNVGIGIDDPAARLEVKQNLYVSHQNAEEITFRLDNYGTTGTDAGPLLRMFNQSGTTVVNIDSRSGSSRDTYFNQGGNFGIGTTSPDFKLDVNGIIRSENSSEVGTLYLGNTAQSQIPGGAIIGQRSPSYSSTGNLLFQVPTWGAGTDYGLTTQMSIEVSTSDTKKATISMIPFGGNVEITNALLSNQENTDVDTGTETVASVAIATYTAAFFDFVIKKTTNVRSGTVYACHDGTNVEFTETSTQDLGDTSDVTLSVDISGGNMRLRATTTSDDWSVKSLIRAI